jgi:LuxR family transcriptional regulator, maltose regulon positive regulatory protein
LRIQTLGGFQVWRGEEAIPSNGWRREKARQLFQLLITYRHSPLDRDQICEHLWPGADPAIAQRNFKITLNTLYQVLEQERDPGAESAFIVREGSTYSLRPGADIRLDIDQFVEAVKGSRNDAELLEKAVGLYKGVYFPETLYETWAAEERERLQSMFLESADRLAEVYIDRNGSPRRWRSASVCWRSTTAGNAPTVT